jgi:hypothetical protein
LFLPLPAVLPIVSLVGGVARDKGTTLPNAPIAAMMPDTNALPTVAAATATGDKLVMTLGAGPSATGKG